jgi:hypothetical protein
MASQHDSSTDSLRRIAALATRLPLALLTAAVLSGCGSAEGFDEPDPVLQSDAGAAPAGALFSPQAAAPGETSGASERPAPTSTVPTVGGKRP